MQVVQLMVRSGEMEVAGHLLPCFQSLLPERSIYGAARLLLDTDQSFKRPIHRCWEA